MACNYDRTFAWEDYLVFGIMLAISSLIGLYFGIQNKRKRKVNADEMLNGNRNLPVLPVALSLSASFTSATTILGIPAEVYQRGGEQWLWCIGLIPCFLIVGFFILPIFYKLELTNAYEYLELRFNKVIRAMGSLAFSVIILVYMAAVLYAPAVALSQVTGLSKEISILTMGLVCTFYTSIGGIRAVVWTDAFQLVVVWAGLLVLMFKGAEDAGGWTKVWDIANEGDRLPRWDFDPDPFVRHTFWTLLIGGGTNMMTVYGANQTNLQRYGSVKTLKGSKVALLLNLPLWIFYLTILCLLGLVMYANFLTTDPLTSGSVSKSDQLIPLFVLKTMGEYPGLSGLFVASIFSASISTLSSGINSLAAVSLEDVFKPCYGRFNRDTPSKSIAAIATIVLVIIFGGLTIGLAYLASFLGKTALSISFGVFGMVGGPLLGLIMNGIFVPFMNSWGAGAGMISSLAVCLYVGIEPILRDYKPGRLPLDSSNCNSNTSMIGNFTSPTATPITAMISNMTTAASGNDDDDDDYLTLSYIHYSTLALLVSFIIGVLVSAITCCNKGRDVDERTFYSYSCSKKSSSYSVNYDEEMNSHKRNSNLARQEVKSSEFDPYVNHSPTKVNTDYTYHNGAYGNHE